MRVQLISLLACSLPSLGLGQGGEIAFVGVTVIPMSEDSAVLHGQTVLVRGERIAAVGPSDEVDVPEGVREIDGSNKFLIPGLADMHVHLEYFPDPDVLKLFLANGVTTVRNMDGRNYILGWKERTSTGELLGPTIYTAGPLLDGDPPILPDNTVVTNAADAREVVVEQASAGYDFIKAYSNLSPEVYRAILATAREAGLPVVGHVPKRVDLDEALDGGQLAIEHLADFSDWIEADESPFHGRWHWSKLFLAMPVDTAKLTAAAVRTARTEVWIVPTMVQAQRAVAAPGLVRQWLDGPELKHVSNEMRADWEERLQGTADRMDDADWALVAQGQANRERLVSALHEAGAKMLIGTDTPNPFVVPGFSLLSELENFVSAGLSPAEALATATRGAAEFFGEPQDWGTVESGSRADLVLLRSNPLNPHFQFDV